MRITGPSFLHSESLSGWATYELKEKSLFVLVTVALMYFRRKEYAHHAVNFLDVSAWF
jgi:hypothetical protein